MELGIRKGENGELRYTRVEICAIDVDGKLIGIPNKKIFNYLRRYKVDYADGMGETMFTNIVSKNLLD